MTALARTFPALEGQWGPSGIVTEQLKRQLPQALLASLARPGDDARVAQAADLGRGEGQDVG